MSQTVSVPPEAAGFAGVVLPAHAGDADAGVAELPPAELPLVLESLLLPQPATASATVAAHAASRVTRFTVAALRVRSMS
jgi:hypothetical protein